MPYHAFLRVSIHCLLSLTSTTRSRVPARIFELTQPSTTSSPIFLPIFENSTSTMRFNVFSTALKFYNTLTHIYDLSQPYLRPPAHFRAHTLISDPPPYFNSISFVTTCFQVFPTSVNCLQTPERVANRPHAFSRQFAPFFYLFFVYFHHF